MLDAHRGEHDGELDVLLQQPRLPDDLRGDAVVRQAVAGKDRQLLAAHQRVHAVNRGQAGLDEFARIAPRKRIDRQAVHVAPIGGQRAARRHRRAGPARRKRGPASAAKPAGGNFRRESGCAQRLVGKPGRAFQNLHHGLRFRNVEHAADARSAGGVDDFHHLVEADIADALDHDQRPFNARRADVLQAAIFDVESEIVHAGVLRFCKFLRQRVEFFADALFQFARAFPVRRCRTWIWRASLAARTAAPRNCASGTPAWIKSRPRR